VRDVAVCGLPADVGDEEIKASIVLAAGATLTAPEFFAFLSDKVPYFAIPRYVDIRAALPVNALERVMKHVLRDEGAPPGAWDLVTQGLVVPRERRRATAAS
jgi:carnitine-CoA ligase